MLDVRTNFCRDKSIMLHMVHISEHRVFALARPNISLCDIHNCMGCNYFYLSEYLWYSDFSDLFGSAKTVVEHVINSLWKQKNKYFFRTLALWDFSLSQYHHHTNDKFDSLYVCSSKHHVGWHSHPEFPSEKTHSWWTESPYIQRWCFSPTDTENRRGLLFKKNPTSCIRKKEVS